MRERTNYAEDNRGGNANGCAPWLLGNKSNPACYIRKSRNVTKRKMFEIIYADPPWTYRDKAHAGKRGVNYKYSTMSLADIAALNVKGIASPDSCLFLWVTMPLLPEGLRVMEAWGFQYKTAAFVWVKTNRKSGTPFTGMGNWTRACAELCLLGTKGKPKRVSKSVHSVVLSPIEIHSKKPDEVRDRIVRLMGDVPRVELFARERARGWEMMGESVDGRDIKELLQVRCSG